MHTTRLTLLTALIATLSSTAAAQDIQAPRVAYDQNRLTEAEQGFAAVLAGGAPAGDRGEAVRGLARIAWLARANIAAAEGLLMPAIEEPEEGCRNLVMLVRFLREADRAGDAYALSETRSGACAEGQDRDALIAHGALAGLEVARARGDTALTERVWTGLDRLSQTAAIASLPQTARLEAAVMRRDAPAALRAWNNFFWLEDGETLPLLGDPKTVFEAGLAQDAPPAERETLADLLMRAGFSGAAEASLPPGGDGPPSDRATTIRACLAFERSVVELMTDINRRMAVDSSIRNETAAELSTRLSELYRVSNGSILEWPARKPGDGPIFAVNQRCNLISSYGFTGGYPSVHLGRLIRKERRRLTDGGTTAATTFNLIDNMVVNGFQSWLWDGDKAAGGWSGGGVVQVRGAYVRSALEAIGLALDPSTRARDEARQLELDESDRLAAADGAIVHLPGMAARLRRQAIAKVAAEAVAAGGDLPRQLALHDYNQTVARSIWIHEGRHALDSARFPGPAALPGGELEYRAKLSELALGRYPRDAFGSINNGLVGEDSSHGKGNSRVLEGYRDWIAAHPEAVADHDPALPPLMQIPKLSDEQIRTVARGLLHECCKDIVDLEVGPTLPL